jgi:uncharacterized RDD family membrane protein YckC
MVENLAGIGRRTLGALIDLVVVLAIFTLFITITGSYEVVREEGTFLLQANIGLALGLGMLLACLLYFVVMEAATGRTLGKWILRTRVVNESGEPPSWRQSVVRNIIRFVDSLPFFYLVGFIAVFSSRHEQRLGDMASRTYVVRG